MDVRLYTSAYEEGNLPIIEYLISSGANLNPQDHPLCTPLDKACEQGQLGVNAKKTI